MNRNNFFLQNDNLRKIFVLFLVIFITACLLFISIIRPNLYRYKTLLKNEFFLKEQYAVHYQQYMDCKIMNQRNQQNLSKKIHSQNLLINTPEIITHLATLAESQTLKIVMIKSKNKKKIINFYREDFLVKLEGNESSLINFISLLAYQILPIQINTLELSLDSDKKLVLLLIIGVFSR